MNDKIVKVEIPASEINSYPIIIGTHILTNIGNLIKSNSKAQKILVVTNEPIYPLFGEKIKKFSKNVTVPGVIFLGMFIAAVELPCTGAPYLAIITLLSLNFNLTAFLMLVLYNIVFVLPLVVILLMVTAGTKIQKVHAFKEAGKGYMRFAIGLMLIGLGWLLILIANGTINFG